MSDIATAKCDNECDTQCDTQCDTECDDRLPCSNLINPKA